MAGWQARLKAALRRTGAPAASGGTRRLIACSAVCLSSLSAATEASAQAMSSDAPVGLDLYVPRPAYATGAPDVVMLGRTLFFDPLLSRDRSLACATCHRPDLAFTDGRRFPAGVADRAGVRNVPAIINLAWGRSFFRDGRADTLEEQVLEPIRSPAELDMTVGDVLMRLERTEHYALAFRSAFGRAPTGNDLARALAAYVRSIRAGDSPFDRLMEGERGALDELERQGLNLFQRRARCVRCHSGPLLGDELFHNTGVAWRSGPPADSGRFHVTRKEADVGAFRTPTLREVARTAPYMHDGSLATLEDVIDFYDGGGHSNPQLDPLMRPLRLSRAEKRALLAFLHTLSGRVVEGASLFE